MDRHVWSVLVNGRRHDVTLALGEGERLVVRVNGRAAARPLVDGDNERLLSIDGAPYLLRRDGGNDFSLIAPDHGMGVRNAPNAGQIMRQTRAGLWAFIALLAVAPLLWYVTHTTYKNTAKRRVTELLEHMHDKAADEAAVGLWLRDTHHLADARELSAASDLFDKWRMQADLYYDGVKSFELVEVRTLSDADVPTALITVNIDGHTRTMRVPDRKAVSWE